MKKAKKLVLTTDDGEVRLVSSLSNRPRSAHPSEWMVPAFPSLDDVAIRHGEEIATEGVMERPIYPRRSFVTFFCRAEAKEISNHGPIRRMAEKAVAFTFVSQFHIIVTLRARIAEPKRECVLLQKRKVNEFEHRGSSFYLVDYSGRILWKVQNANGFTLPFDLIKPTMVLDARHE